MKRSKKFILPLGDQTNHKLTEKFLFRMLFQKSVFPKINFDEARGRGPRLKPTHDRDERQDERHIEREPLTREKDRAKAKYCKRV